VGDRGDAAAEATGLRHNRVHEEGHVISHDIDDRLRTRDVDADEDLTRGAGVGEFAMAASPFDELLLTEVFSVLVGQMFKVVMKELGLSFSTTDE
jgi:hypothetical protein